MEWGNSMKVQFLEMNHNETKKVVEKGRLGRHLPEGILGQCRREALLTQVGL